MVLFELDKTATNKFKHGPSRHHILIVSRSLDPKKELT